MSVKVAAFPVSSLGGKESDRTVIGNQDRRSKRYQHRLLERPKLCAHSLVQHDAAIDMCGQIGIIGNKDHGPGLLLAAEASENCFTHCWGNIVENALENKELRPPQNGPRDQNAYDVGWRENLAGAPDVSFQALGQRIDLFFEFSKAKRPS